MSLRAQDEGFPPKESIDYRLGMTICEEEGPHNHEIGPKNLWIFGNCGFPEIDPLKSVLPLRNFTPGW